jgi:hypothetical protein
VRCATFRSGRTQAHLLDAEKESPKYERAATKFVRRYLDEKSPTLKNFAKVVQSFEQRQGD